MRKAVRVLLLALALLALGFGAGAWTVGKFRAEPAERAARVRDASQAAGVYGLTHDARTPALTLLVARGTLATPVVVACSVSSPSAVVSAGSSAEICTTNVWVGKLS